MPHEKPTDHPKVKAPKVGVLLLNLGTPDATGYWPVRRYLREFLSDPRGIEANPLIWVPLYPQYSATTIATANDKAFDVLKTMRWQPAVRTAPAYFDDPFYIETLANSIDEGVKRLDFVPDLVITSYHGMPKTYLERGD